ncbi:MAG: hypothetical protein ACYC5M_12035 [Anaerolineae bacterium]
MAAQHSRPFDQVYLDVSLREIVRSRKPGYSATNDQDIRASMHARASLEEDFVGSTSLAEGKPLASCNIQ